MQQSDLIALFAQRPSAFAWMIGAGASRMSGLPTANDIINDLKRRYYCQQENVDISLQDMRSEPVQMRIQSFMDARGFPPLWSNEEYSTYFDKIFGQDKARQRNYLRTMLSEEKVTLTSGNRVMAAMLAAGYLRVLFTTNFDSVVERAFAEISARSLTAYHLEGSSAALQALNNEEYPLYVKLHGDFRHDSVKNLTADLLSQNEELARCMVAAASRFGLIVTGYSGRDASVMALMRDALNQPNAFPSGLFWTNIKNTNVLPEVTDLIALAKEKGVRAEIVDIETFDTLMLRLWRNIDGKPNDFDAKVRRASSAEVNIPVPAVGSSRPLLRLNALPIQQLPKQALSIETNTGISWAEVRQMQRIAKSKVVFTKGERLLAWGDSAEIKRLCGNRFVSMNAVDLPEDITGPDTFYIHGFMEEALAASLARGRAVIARSSHRGSVLIINRSANDSDEVESLKAAAGGLWGPVPNLIAPATEEFPTPEPLFWAEALRVSLSWKNGQPWLLIDPDVWIWPTRARELAADFLDKRKGARYNKQYDALLSAWCELLFGKTSTPIVSLFSLLDSGDTASSPTFSIGSRTGFSLRLVT